VNCWPHYTDSLCSLSSMGRWDRGHYSACMTGLPANKITPFKA